MIKILRILLFVFFLFFFPACSQKPDSVQLSPQGTIQTQPSPNEDTTYLPTHTEISVSATQPIIISTPTHQRQVIGCSNAQNIVSLKTPQLEGWFSKITFSPDGEKLLVMTHDAYQEWKIADWELLSDEVVDVKYTSASYSLNGDIRLLTFWPHTGRINYCNMQIETPFKFDEYGVKSDVSSDEKLIALSVESVLTLWRISDGQLLHHLSGDSEAISYLTFNPDGGFLISGGEDGEVIIWDTELGTRVNSLKGHTRRIQDIVFSHDGDLLATASLDGHIMLWSFPEGELLYNLSSHDGGVYSIAFSPDGEVLASGGEDTLVSPNAPNTIKLWNTSTGELLHTLSEHNGLINSLAFSPSGTQLVSVGWDKRIIFWGLP